jgi:hypothetical protein
MRKLETTADGFHVRIEEAYWQNAAGQRFKKADGVFPLFLCLEQESVSEDDGEFLTQS